MEADGIGLYSVCFCKRLYRKEEDLVAHKRKEHPEIFISLPPETDIIPVTVKPTTEPRGEMKCKDKNRDRNSDICSDSYGDSSDSSDCLIIEPPSDSDKKSIKIKSKSEILNQAKKENAKPAAKDRVKLVDLQLEDQKAKSPETRGSKSSPANETQQLPPVKTTTPGPSGTRDPIYYVSLPQILKQANLHVLRKSPTATASTSPDQNPPVLSPQLSTSGPTNNATPFDKGKNVQGSKADGDSPDGSRMPILKRMVQLPRKKKIYRKEKLRTCFSKSVYKCRHCKKHFRLLKNRTRHERVVHGRLQHRKLPARENKISKKVKSAVSDQSSISVATNQLDDETSSTDEIYICPVCNKAGEAPMRWIQCDDCQKWLHYPCTGITKDPAPHEKWYCSFCEIQPDVNPKPGPRAAVKAKPGPSAVKPKPGPSPVKLKPGPSAVKPKPGPPADNPKPGPPADNPKPGPSVVKPRPGPFAVEPKPLPSKEVHDNSGNSRTCTSREPKAKTCAVCAHLGISASMIDCSSCVATFHLACIGFQRFPLKKTTWHCTSCFLVNLSEEKSEAKDQSICQKLKARSRNWSGSSEDKNEDVKTHPEKKFKPNKTGSPSMKKDTGINQKNSKVNSSVVGEKSYECPLCFKHYITEHYLAEHIALVHSKHNVGNKVGRPQKSVQNNPNVVLTTQSPIPIRQMEFNFEEEQIIQTTCNIHENRLNCKYCPYFTGISEKHHFLRHIALSHPNLKMKYQTSTKSSNSPTLTPRSSPPVVAKQRPPKEKRYECSVCGKRYISPELCIDHQDTHTNTKRHSCPFCPTRFRWRNALNPHIRAQHPEKVL